MKLDLFDDVLAGNTVYEDLIVIKLYVVLDMTTGISYVPGIFLWKLATMLV